jgi:hypothetical protein
VGRRQWRSLQVMEQRAQKIRNQIYDSEGVAGRVDAVIERVVRGEREGVEKRTPCLKVLRQRQDNHVRASCCRLALHGLLRIWVPHRGRRGPLPLTLSRPLFESSSQLNNSTSECCWRPLSWSPCRPKRPLRRPPRSLPTKSLR